MVGTPVDPGTINYCRETWLNLHDVEVAIAIHWMTSVPVHRLSFRQEKLRLHMTPVGYGAAVPAASGSANRYPMSKP